MRKKRRWTTALLVFILLAGLVLLLYPTVSDYWNSFRQTKVISDYAQEIHSIDQERYDDLIESAREYNDTLRTRNNEYILTDTQKEQYEALLNVSGSGAMGYIEIPSIGCSLPIYHGTSNAVLQIAIGHLEWSSLPVGGEGTHCVLSGHRGLPSAKLFTDLDKMAVGDLFMLRILDEVMTYEVDQLLVVEPHETEALLIEPGKDYCSLVTCTPYGVNTHRILVRGHRVENVEKARIIRLTADAIQIKPVLVAPVVAAPILLVLLILLALPQRPKYHGRSER